MTHDHREHGSNFFTVTFSSLCVRAPLLHGHDTELLQLSMETSNAPSKVEITSCLIGGHILGRGAAVQKQCQAQFPNAAVSHKVGCPLTFSIKADDKPVGTRIGSSSADQSVNIMTCFQLLAFTLLLAQVVSGMSGTCTILQLLTCFTSPSAVVEKASLAGTERPASAPMAVSG